MNSLHTDWSLSVTNHLSLFTHERILMGCRALIGLHVVLRTIVFGAGFFYWDDYVLEGKAALHPIASADYLLYLHNGHLMPGGLLVTGIIERVAPLNYWLVLIVLVGMQFLATWLTYRLLLALMGPRPVLLVLVGLLCLTPMTLLPGAWWSAAINFMPLQIAIGLTGLLTLRALRVPSRGAQLVALAVLAGGLAFFEKAVFIPIIVVAVTVATGPFDRGLLDGLREALRRLWLYWVGAALLIGAYLIYYLSRATELSRELFDSTGIVILVTETVIRGLVPSVIGGPLAYEAAGFGTALADPAPLVVVASVGLVTAFVAYGLIQSRRSRAAWTLAGIWIAGDLLTLVLGRSGYDIILSLGNSLRYTVDALVIVLIAVSVTLAAPVGQQESPTATRVRAWFARDSQDARVAQGGAIAVVGLLIGAALASHVTLVTPLAANASRSWLMNIRQAIQEQAAMIRVLDAPVPANVYDSLGYPNNLLSHVLAPLSADVQVVDAISTPVMFDESGQLVSATVRGVDSFPGPDGDCGWAVKDVPVSIPIDGDLFPWQYTMRIRYLASENASLRVKLGQEDAVSVDVLEGPNEVLLTIHGGGSRVSVGPFDGPGGVCVAQITVGDLVPMTGQ